VTFGLSSPSTRRRSHHGGAMLSNELGRWSKCCCAVLLQCEVGRRSLWDGGSSQRDPRAVLGNIIDWRWQPSAADRRHNPASMSLPRRPDIRPSRRSAACSPEWTKIGIANRESQIDERRMIMGWLWCVVIHVTRPNAQPEISYFSWAGKLLLLLPLLANCW